MPLTAVNPESLAPPRGYNHGMRGTGQLLFVDGGASAMEPVFPLAIQGIK